MKIAVNASILDKRPSGLGVYTVNVLAGLDRALAAGDSMLVYSSVEAVLAPQRSENRFAPVLTRPEYGKKGGIARFLWGQTLFPLAARAAGADIIYSTTHHGTFFPGRPQVITLHDMLPLRFPAQHRLQHCYFAYILPRMLEKCAAVITDSQSTKNDIIADYGFPMEKIHVCYCSVDNSLFRPRPQAQIDAVKNKYGLERYFLMVGASYPHKNMERAILAFAEMRDSFRGGQLVIAGGRGEYRQVLRRFAAKTGAADAVVFLDYIGAEALSALYGGAAALVFPSLYEGFGLPPLEAMSCGCPVICSNTSSLPEVCGGAACYVNPERADEIADAMRAFAADGALRRQLAEKGLARAPEFSWEKTAGGVKRVLETILLRPA